MGHSRFIFLPVVVIPIFSLWMKTYIVYKLTFNIEIENWTQEFILFINPLSFLMVLFGMAFFFKGKGQFHYMMFVSVVLSFFLFGNILFYRFFNDFLTLPILFQGSHLADLGSSIHELLSITDLFYFLDLLVLFFIFYGKKVLIIPQWGIGTIQKAYFLIAGGILFLNIGLAEMERPELLMRTFDREIVVKNIGTYNYILYDLFLQSKASAQRVLADGSELIDIENYIRAHYGKPNEDLFGIGKGKNIILISLESLQNFVIQRKINGEEVTPFLNRFIEESYYFENFYHQTGQGKTSDSEFIIENSLYPLSRGAVFFTHSGNHFEATPHILKEYGYYSAVLHGNNKSFWNRDIMYRSLGFDRFFHRDDFFVNEENSVGWGIKDIDFFEQSIEHLKQLPTPFYAKLITLTNHFPFEIGEEDVLISPYHSNSRTLNRYMTTVRYLDEAVKIFIEKLKENGLYEKSIIIMYGDHYGISEKHNKAMSQLLNEEITPFVSTQLQRVPLIIHIPGQEGEIIKTVSGQIDLRPTILHLVGIHTKGMIQFGTDLFSEDKLQFTVLRDGSFITEKYLYSKGNCYLRESGEKINRNICKPYNERAKNELHYSDVIIYGDLLRFYPSN